MTITRTVCREVKEVWTLPLDDALVQTVNESIKHWTPAGADYGEITMEDIISVIDDNANDIPARLTEYLQFEVIRTHFYHTTLEHLIADIVSDIMGEKAEIHVDYDDISDMYTEVER